ncbi:MULTISPECIES: HigA family addiction module antitoxin [unclassified Acinetobacter]|jgi:addiction module HigA family antidote|uniref:HigA family addiction module antitoxin n=2 Tax=Moraxellaceae TaxID=468 RepID=UPI0015D1D9D0|nr:MULTISPECIES: HigA family addiction module antitoxin [unclassified Acinetobacter]
MIHHNGMRAVHPGEILKEEYMLPLNLSSTALARKLGVTAARINDIVLERRGITADTALRLARFFGGDAESWLNLQHQYDLKIAYEKAGKTIEQTIRPYDDLLAFA